MERQFYIICFALCLLTLICLQPLIVQAAEPPASPEQLLARVESAIKKKETEDLLKLFYWKGVSAKMRALTTRLTSEIIKEDIVKISLSSVPTEIRDITDGHTRDGILYQPNVSVMGVIVCQFRERGNFWKIPYGKKGNAFYISGVAERRLYTPKVKEKLLQVIVGAQELQIGYCNYLKGGKEMKIELNRKGGSQAFWGDRITYCTVGSSSDDEIWLVIMEGSQRIFETKPKKTEKPIEYKAVPN